jgi:hypothetical protein
MEPGGFFAPFDLKKKIVAQGEKSCHTYLPSTENNNKLPWKKVIFLQIVQLTCV